MYQADVKNIKVDFIILLSKWTISQKSMNWDKVTYYMLKVVIFKETYQQILMFILKQPYNSREQKLLET